MKIRETKLKGVYILEPQLFGDERGWFMETYSERDFLEAGIDVHFVQDNHSFSRQKGVLRGLHYQLNPCSQAKLIRCIKGEILDVAVDLRRGSRNYGKWTGAVLSAENKKEFFISRGFAHGFITLTDNVEVFYKVDNFYAPQLERNIRFDDPFLAIDWQMVPTVLSKKDLQAPFLKDVYDLNFTYEEMKK